MKIKLLLLLLFLLSNTLQAQENNGRNTYFNISYFAILGTHPGIKLGIQYPFAQLNKTQQLERSQELLGAANMIFYYHRRNQIGLGFNLELGFRHRKQDGLNKEVFIGAGYLRTILPNKVYDFDTGEAPIIRGSAGRHHFLKTAAIGLGRNLDGELNNTFWNIKPTLHHLRPFNRKGGFNFALDAGLHFH